MGSIRISESDESVRAFLFIWTEKDNSSVTGIYIVLCKFSIKHVVYITYYNLLRKGKNVVSMEKIYLIVR